MKNITKSLIALFAVLAISCSSDDVEDRPVITAGDAPVLLAPDGASSYVLTIENEANLAERFVWSNANFGQDVAINYEVELDSLNGNFSTPRSLGTVIGANQLSVSVVTLNNAVIALGGDPAVESQYKVRVKASVNASFEALYSEPVTITVTPYQAFVPLANIYIMGDATEYGYNNNGGNAPMFRDPANQYKYYYTGYFTANGIKFLSTLGSWHPQYGAVSEGVLGVSNADGSNEPGPIMVATAGYYTLTIDVDEMTYSLEPFVYNPVTMPVYTTVGITGSATPEGWPDNGIQDVDMVASTANPHLWKISNIVLSAAEAKFRANDAWDVNWGAGTPTSGQATIGGSNIPVEAEGSYNVWFNDLDGRYIFIKQ